MHVLLIEIVVNMYKQTTVPSLFAYIFCSMFFLIYLYTSYYERLHGRSWKKVRTYKMWNYPPTLYLFGTATIVVHHLSIANGCANTLPGNTNNRGLAGFTIMGIGLVLVCLA